MVQNILIGGLAGAFVLSLLSGAFVIFGLAVIVLTLIEAISHWARLPAIAKMFLVISACLVGFALFHTISTQ